MKAQIVADLEVSRDMSFAELAGRWPEHFRDGPYLLPWPKLENVFIWVGLTEDALRLIEELLNEGLAELGSTSYLVYVADGMMPTQPIAKRFRSYKAPHWVPSVLLLPGVDRRSRKHPGKAQHG
jgi:hypothetical protein